MTAGTTGATFAGSARMAVTVGTDRARTRDARVRVLRLADAANIRSWMIANLDRMHIFVRPPSSELLTSVELYVRARIGSVYEGAA